MPNTTTTACFTRYSKSPQFDTLAQPFQWIPSLSRVNRRPFSTPWLVTVLLLALALAHWPTPVHAADEVEIVQAHLELSDEGYRLSSTFAFDLNRELEDALTRGIPLYFTTDVEIIRPRWYWFDENAISATQTIRISYNLLTRQYRASIAGSLYQSFSSLDDALVLVRRPARWLIADRNALKPGQTYTVAVHMGLDVAQLPKPFQVNALNNRDWRMSSDWKTFSFKVDKP